MELFSTDSLVQVLIGVVICLIGWIATKIYSTVKKTGKFYDIDDDTWKSEQGPAEHNYEIEVKVGLPLISELHPVSAWLKGRYFRLSEDKILQKSEIRKIVNDIRNSQEFGFIEISWYTCTGDNRRGEPTVYSIPGVRVCAEAPSTRWKRIKDFLTRQGRMTLYREINDDQPK